MSGGELSSQGGLQPNETLQKHPQSSIRRKCKPCTLVGMSLSKLRVTLPVHFPDPFDQTKLLFHFHSSLSDSREQDSSTLDNHMEMLIKCLKETGVLRTGGRILGSSDGCAKQ